MLPGRAKPKGEITHSRGFSPRSGAVLPPSIWQDFWVKSCFNKGLRRGIRPGPHAARMLRSHGCRVGGFLDSPLPMVWSPHLLLEDPLMAWTKPELEVVSVTMEVTAYAATL